MTDDLSRLRLRDGEEPDARHLRALDDSIARSQLIGGRDVRLTSLPFGTIVNYDSGSGGGYVAPFFAPSIGRTSEGLEVSFAKGLISGLEPTIGELAISEIDPRTGRTPSLPLKEADFNALGECKVFFRLEINRDWELSKIFPVASPEYLQDSAWVTHKLAVIVYRTGRMFRQLVANQSWLAVNRRSTGRAQHLFWPRY